MNNKVDFSFSKIKEIFGGFKKENHFLLRNQQKKLR